MKIRYLTNFVLLLAMVAMLTLVANRVVKKQYVEAVYEEQDKAIIERYLNKFESKKELPVGELMIEIGREFIGTPYVEKTLEKEGEEVLVVNLREQDCVTFVENCLAIARTIKRAKPSFDSFARELVKIRYRNGKLKGYPSRLHYFSEWILDKERMGLVKDVTPQLSETELGVKLEFMSKNPGSYYQLKNDSTLIKAIKKAEEKTSEETFYYVPQESFYSVEDSIKDGDIAAITTNVKGLAISHVGLLFSQNNKIYLMHASSVEKKVVISGTGFYEYLVKNKNTSGVMIARPIGE